MSVSGLAYVALAVRDVEATAGVLEHQLGLGHRRAQTPQGRSIAFLGIGQSALAVLVHDDAFLGDGAVPGVHHLALKTADIDATRSTLSHQGLSVIEVQGYPGTSGVAPGAYRIHSSAFPFRPSGAPGGAR